ncbi:hypothetical protein [Haliea sp.]|uniref:hypothetical protein n=1 Tax=Haliea sp. TaxID=1932666 RepID=UPI000C42306E|nr:hypothetical protein [Haliea sp.]MAY92662.1 hypothetical protein [Haliea sp.]
MHALWPQTPECWALMETRATFAAAEDANSETVEAGAAHLKATVPVYLVYFTACAVGSDVLFRRDVDAIGQHYSNVPDELIRAHRKTA